MMISDRSQDMDSSLPDGTIFMTDYRWADVAQEAGSSPIASVLLHKDHGS